jgi:hypothetical protein
MASVYSINKGVSKPIVFRGLKAQYIAYLAVGLVLLLVTFGILYVMDISLWIVLPGTALLGSCLFYTVFKLNHTFGEHGLMKFLAKRKLPSSICFRSRRLFINLKYRKYD